MYGGGGGQKVCCSTLSNYWGGLPPAPWPLPSSYAYVPLDRPQMYGLPLHHHTSDYTCSVPGDHCADSESVRKQSSAEANAMGQAEANARGQTEANARGRLKPM